MRLPENGRKQKIYISTLYSIMMCPVLVLGLCRIIGMSHFAKLLGHFIFILKTM